MAFHCVCPAWEGPEQLLAGPMTLGVCTLLSQHLYFKEAELWMEPKSFPGLSRLHEYVSLHCDAMLCFRGEKGIFAKGVRISLIVSSFQIVHRLLWSESPLLGTLTLGVFSLE